LFHCRKLGPRTVGPRSPICLGEQLSIFQGTYLELKFPGYNCPFFQGRKLGPRAKVSGGYNCPFFSKQKVGPPDIWAPEPKFLGEQLSIYQGTYLGSRTVGPKSPICPGSKCTFFKAKFLTPGQLGPRSQIYFFHGKKLGPLDS